MSIRLSDLAASPKARYRTDKVDHGYLPFYEKHLPEAVGRFMEIGVLTGDSLRMFRDYYKGLGVFHALDVFVPGTGVVSPQQLESEGFVVHQGSQSDTALLQSIKHQFDVIIDDGSHHSDEQINTFKHLFINNVKPGGLYVVEDLCCCREPYWWRGVVDGYENTLLGLIESRRFVSQLISPAEAELLYSQIQSILLEDSRKNPIAFIRKKLC